MQPIRSSTKQAKISLDRELARLAFFLAETWKDDHPDACSTSPTDFQDCVAYVTAEMVTAANAVGGPIGLEISTGGGSKAACTVCKQVLAKSSRSSNNTGRCC